MEGDILIVVMNTELHRGREREVKYLETLFWSAQWRHGTVSRSHQPSLECDGVDVELCDQAQVMVHVFQTAQHLQNKGTHH